jgi:PAS domain S-box-containing protein
MRARQIAPVALVVVLTVAGFVGARALVERDARRDSEHRADVAAAQIRGRLDQGASLAESLRRYMVGAAGDAFSTTASRWLSSAGFPAAAWVEQIADDDRAAYEQRLGAPIIARDRQRQGTRATYLPATLVSGISPMDAPGIDLGGEAGMAAALARAGSLYDAGATPLTTLSDGSRGLFLVRDAPRLRDGIVEPGFVVVFVSELWLRAAATDTPKLQLTVGGGRRGAGVHHTFAAAGQPFDVAVPKETVEGAAEALPWIILAAGLGLAALAAALGLNAARRARAQEEVDRIFNLSRDVITVADFDGNLRRVNPAAEEVLGYTRQELLERPYLELVHPDDRAATAEEAAALADGRTTLSFANRFARKDGTYRTLEWTATPVPDEGVIYGVARDATERTRLAAEQEALRRVATLVARGVPAQEVFASVAEEVSRLLDARAVAIKRAEDDTIVAGELPAGDAVTVPIMVEGAVWGTVVAGTDAPDARRRVAEFTELAGTAIANAASRSELTASRARVVAASDQTRRQIERDLHDGAQQRLVHTVITLKLALQMTDESERAKFVAEALEQAEQANVELRELVHGILPPALQAGGLPTAVKVLASRMSLPVELDVDVPRLPDAVEATAYFVIAEALTNVTKHARAEHASVRARVEDTRLRIQVRDDGVGGARVEGSGFLGLADRLAVFEGRLRVESPPGGGTLVSAELRVDI